LRLPGAMPLTPRLQGVFRRRIDALPDATRTVMLIAAADNTGDVAAVFRAGAELRLPADALDPAENSGLIRTSGGAIRFRHPLVRSAVYDDAPLSRRQQAHAARYRAWVLRAPTDARRSLLARCEALLASRPPGEAFAEAAGLAGSLPPFQRARSELLYGEWLRRERKRTEARARLRAAAELFRTLGTVVWAERAEAELRATGETARKREPSTADQLTPQELQIASLAAEGLTNRDIAAQLFLSPRTIEYHLRKVFTKLRIASRTDLIRHWRPGNGP
jgi:DNA-binding CsgD family transcriptional regulator